MSQQVEKNLCWNGGREVASLPPLCGNRAIGFKSTSHPTSYNPEWPAQTDAEPLFAKDPLIPICSLTVSLDGLLHDCSPYRSHRSLLYLGGYILDGRSRAHTN
jgi:hypothetical protein